MAAGAERGAPAIRGAAVSPARNCAFAVIRRVFEQGAFADRALQSEASGLGPRDRALATALAYGTVQRRGTLDYVASKLTSGPLERLDPPVLAAVRLGLFQLLFLDGVAEHAAVNESVELAKAQQRAGASMPSFAGPRAKGGRGSTNSMTAPPRTPRSSTRSRLGWPSAGGRSSAWIARGR